MWKWLRVPEGVHRGIKKQDRPHAACASTRKASHMGAEINHLCPVIKYSLEDAVPILSALLVLARTSDPPCFSVMPMPNSTPDFSWAGKNRGSYLEERILGSHSRARSASVRNAAIQEKVMEMGHVCPASFCAVSMSRAARATCAPFRLSMFADFPISHGRL